MWCEIPTKVKNKLISQINRCFIEHSEHRGSPSIYKYDDLACSLQVELDDIIYPSPETPCRILEQLELVNLLHHAKTDANDGNQAEGKKSNPSSEDALTLKQKNVISRYVADMTRLVQKAIKVFRMLDTKKKGSVDKDDIYRAIHELDSTTTTDGAVEDLNAPGNKYEYIISMMTDFTGNITVYCDDIVRIAKLVNL